MQEDEETAWLQDALGQKSRHHLFVWTLRRMVARRGVCPVVAREFTDACGEDAAEALAVFRVFVQMLGYAGRRQLSIGHPGCFGVTGDERQLLSLVAAAQNHDEPRFEASLCWVARIEVRQQFATVVRALAAAFASHNVRISSAAPAMAVAMIDRPHPRMSSKAGPV